MLFIKKHLLQLKDTLLAIRDRIVIYITYRILHFILSRCGIISKR